MQNYFVTNHDRFNFVSIDVSPSILNLNISKLFLEELKALVSFEKMNILAFKVVEKSKTSLDLEKNKLVKILKDIIN